MAENLKVTRHRNGEEVAGGKMKSTRTEPDSHPRWDGPNEGSTNESGFSGLPGGLRHTNGDFGNRGFGGYWWSSTELGNNYAWYCYLSYTTEAVYGGIDFKYFGYSVRCVMDDVVSQLTFTIP